MFNVDRATAKLAHVNFYTEKHGDDDVSGLAVKLVLDLPATILDTFNARLRSSFYAINKADMPLLFPEVDQIAWSRELVGASVLIGYEDLFDSDPIALESVTVDKFRFAPKNGGTVEITLRVKCNPEAGTVGKLYQWLQKDVLLTVVPPAAGLTIEPDDLVSRASRDAAEKSKAASGAEA